MKELLLGFKKVKLIQTNSFIKLSYDINRQPSFLPEDGRSSQDSLFCQNKKDKKSIVNKWKRNKKVPTETIYQFGIDIPTVKK